MASLKRTAPTQDTSLAPAKARKVYEEQSIEIETSKLEKVPFPNFRKPQEVATFSATNSLSDNAQKIAAEQNACKPKERKLCHNAKENLMNLVVPPSLTNLRWDLNRGYSTQIEKNNDKEFMNLLLKCIHVNNLVENTDFVCWRGLLTKIGASPYDAGGRFDDGLKVVVQKVGDIIYMHEFPTPQMQKKKETLDERQKLMQYWGMKFESYLTAKPGRTPDTESPMDLNLEYGSVVRTKIGPHALLFGGEVDCCLPDNLNHYVELKTTRECSHEGQERSFRKFKLLKWWLQSFLIGIDDILCGFRDDHGIVERCKWFKVSEIPKIIKQDRDTWRPVACLAFLEQFLNFVKSNVTKDRVSHVITRHPGQKIFYLNVDEDEDYEFLPIWFMEKYG